MITIKLIEICDIITRGISPNYTTNEDEGIRILNQKCIRDHKISYDLSRLHNIAQKSVQGAKFIKNGDILVNSTGQGTLGRTALAEDIKGELLVDSHITIIRPKKGLFDPGYLAYLISMREGDFVKMATGTSGQTELPRLHLNEYLITYEESFEKQRMMVDRLDETFEKINQAVELAQKNLSYLHAMKQSMLNQTFSQDGLE